MQRVQLLIGGRDVDAAAAAFPTWSSLGPSARRAKLLRAADVLEAQAGRFVEAVTTETGATAGWTHFNVFLAAGNTVILKASEICPATHRLIGTVLQEAGLEPGVINVITHDAGSAPAVVEGMIAHKAVRRVNFTGSTGVGRSVALLAAKYLKPVLLELGGKAPLIVLADADIDAAVDATVFGAYANQGQICMSTERVIIEEPVADEFARQAEPPRRGPAKRRSAPGRGGARIGGRPGHGRARAAAGQCGGRAGR